jgi:hypothetical protein
VHGKLRFLGGCAVAALVGLLLAVMLNEAGISLWH